ncbi:hypothetical protein Tco_0615050 [Tanacetum coccineum]
MPLIRNLLQSIIHSLWIAATSQQPIISLGIATVDVSEVHMLSLCPSRRGCNEVMEVVGWMLGGDKEASKVVDHGGVRVDAWFELGKDIKVKKSKNEQKPTRNEETSDQEKDLKPISKAGSRPWLRKDKKVKKRTK